MVDKNGAKCNMGFWRKTNNTPDTMPMIAHGEPGGQVLVGNTKWPVVLRSQSGPVAGVPSLHLHYN